MIQKLAEKSFSEGICYDTDVSPLTWNATEVAKIRVYASSVVIES